MIKVLEHGIRKVTCPNCKAKLQYEQEDILEKELDSFLIDGVEIRKYIVCPDCGEEIILTPIKR